MAALKILLADADVKYLHVLKRRFTEELKNEASIETITDRDFFMRQFSAPQTLDLLVVAEGWYDAGLERHDIANLFLLAENKGAAPRNNHIAIYKYNAVKALYESIFHNCVFRRSTDKVQAAAAKVIAVYSPIGGAGATTVAVGLGMALARQRKKVLFFGTDSLQNFGHLLGGERLPGGAERALYSEKGAADVFEQLKPLLKSYAGLTYLPPFQQPLAALRWKAEHWINLCQFVKRSMQYDYIILDCSSEFSAGNSRLLGFADLRLVLAGQGRADVHKLCNFTRCFDCSVGRTEYICNRYDKGKPNCLLEESVAAGAPVKEYLEESPELAAAEGLLQTNALDRLISLAEGE